MEAESLTCMTSMNLCPRCMMLFLAPKGEGFLKLSEDLIVEQIKRIATGISSDIEYSWNNKIDNKKQYICPCCFDAFKGNNIEEVCVKIHSDLIQKNIDLKRSVFIRIIIPPMLDTARITVRTIVTKTNEKTFVFPTMSELTTRLIVENLKFKGLNIVSDITVADFQVAITGFISNQTEYLLALYPEYKHKKKKRKFGEAASEETFEVTRADADSVLIYYKSFGPKDFNKLELLLKGYMDKIATINIVDEILSDSSLVQTSSSSSSILTPSSSSLSSSTPLSPSISSSTSAPSISSSFSSSFGLSWTLETSPSPVYLLGRYRKYARDVPQAPWTLGDERKGRNSVEEIVTEAVMKSLKGSSCKLHPCGREDIDVRCLGNGRPFILEVSGSYVHPSDERMTEIMESVRSRDSQSLNKEGDVEVLMLKKSHRSVWENMQTVAEEKRKAYRCVCWSANPITKDILKTLESFSSTDSTDEEGRPCLKLVQKTPLRVLHRRSLLDRVRYVYNIRTAQLNDHFFLMDITTSAGTYVKEFVHGDLGRTVPSVCSLLNCQADILQLDVVWLFDDFEGGGEPTEERASESYYNSSTSNSVIKCSDSNGKRKNQEDAIQNAVGDDKIYVINNDQDNSMCQREIKNEDKMDEITKETKKISEVEKKLPLNKSLVSFSWKDLQNMKIMKKKSCIEVKK